MEKALKLYNSKGAFPSADNQIEILGFNYDAKRMGGAPIITGTVMHGSCLDGVWTDDVYVSFNGEKYYLKQTPTSSKSNTDARYKHECEFVSERIKLDNVYFIDAVVGDPQESDRVATNSATFSFFGTILEFAERLNAGLQYSKLQSKNESGEISGYYVEVGNLVDKDGNEFDKEEKFLSFDKVPFSVALQESYNQFGIPYYFEGKKIVFGFYEHAINTVFKYGADQSLLSITKNNANQKIINRCTGVGSEENIPYYYPNEHPLGIVDTYYTPNNGNKELRNDLVVNEEKFAAKVKNGTRLTYDRIDIGELMSTLYVYNKQTADDFISNYGSLNGHLNYGGWISAPDWVYNINDNAENRALTTLGTYLSFNAVTEQIRFSKNNTDVAIKVKLNYLIENISDEDKLVFTATLNFSGNIKPTYYTQLYFPNHKTTGVIELESAPIDEGWEKKYLNGNDYVYIVFSIDESSFESNPRRSAATRATTQTNIPVRGSGVTSYGASVNISVKTDGKINVYTWRNEDNKTINLSSYGLEYKSEPSLGDTITFETKKDSLLPYQNALMPPIYIESGGEERFYNALDKTYKDENGNYYKFFNTYSDSKRKEHIVDFHDIKPSINNVKNSKGEYINSFIDIAFDKNDNDETYEEEDGGSLKYLHPYFYVKLRKFDGEYGFNLFDHASEQGEMTISITSGHCGACNFVIGVDENTKKNILQVDDSGDLVWDSKTGMPKFGDPQDRQNDTRNNEVWIALKKDIETYGHIMPSGNLKPAIGDTFVITNISLPTVYLREAEKRLEEAIIKFMYENNIEKFTFSIKFSRIYLEEHPEILALLNENSLINIEYNGERKTLYVNSFSYKKEANTVLPEITIELAETLSASQNALQTAINEVKVDMLNSFQKMDIAAMIASKFISKENEDQAQQRITFNRGLNVGSQDETKAKIDEAGNADVISQIIRQYISTPQFIDGFAGSGFKLWLDENGKSNLTVDNITAREVFRVFEMLVTKIRAVNGGLFVSAANGTIKEVVDSGDYYDITLENENSFVAGDYMRCQVMSGLMMMAYWVEVASTNGKTCRVLKSEFGSATPLAGQDVVLDGSKDANRQSAIYITASEDGLPRIEVLDNISTKSHDGCLRTRLGSLKDIVDASFGKLSGYGLYSDNAYLKGEFIVKSTGESVDTMFAVTDGKIQSAVTNLQNEVSKERNFLQNGSFTQGLKYWVTSNDDKLLMSADNFLLDNDSILYDTVSVSCEPLYDNIHYVTLKGTNSKYAWIREAHYNFIGLPEFESGKDYPLVIRFNYRAKASGLAVFHKGTTFPAIFSIAPTDEFVTKTIETTWNGTGDFELRSNTEIDIYGISIYTETTEAKYRTFFDQSDRLIKFGAESIDDDGNIINGSKVEVTPQGTYLKVAYKDENENVKEQTLGTFETYTEDEATKTKVKFSGDNVILEGDISANGNFSIDAETGTVTAKAATFKKAFVENSRVENSIVTGGFTTPFRGGRFSIAQGGESAMAYKGLHDCNNIVINSGKLSGSLRPDDAVPFVLPWTSEYIGFRATIINWKWDNIDPEHAMRSNTDGTQGAVPSEGQYIFEDGYTTNAIMIRPREGVELMGFGEGENFRGWIVLNRFWVGNRKPGFEEKAIIRGYIKQNTDETKTIKYRTSLPAELTFTSPNYDERKGITTINFNYTLTEDYMVIVTGYDGAFASVKKIRQNGFDVYTATHKNDDVYQPLTYSNTSGFSFIVINTEQRYDPNASYDINWN